MFIIEGSDCLGKTTIANKIVNNDLGLDEHLITTEINYPFYYSHMTRPVEGVFDFFYDYKDMMSKYAIQDRFHIGGWVYHNRKISLEQLKIIEGWLYSLGSFIMVLYASDEEWYKTHVTNLFMENRKELFKLDELVEFNRRFTKLVKNNNYETPKWDMALDVSNGEFASNDFIKTMLSQWKRRLNLLPRHGIHYDI